MNDVFTLSLPKDLSPQQVAELKQGILELDGVDDAGSLDTRSIDPTTVGLWIQAAAGILGGISGAVVLVEKIRDMLRSKNIKGATLRFEGGEVSFDEISPADLKTVISGFEG